MKCERCSVDISKERILAGVCINCLNEVYRNLIVHEEFIIAFSEDKVFNFKNNEFSFYILNLIPQNKHRELFLMEIQSLRTFWRGRAGISLDENQFIQHICTRDEKESVQDWILRGKSLINIKYIQNLRTAHRLR